MPRLTPVKVEEATGQTAELYGAIKKQLGGVPNLFQALGANPKVLEAYLDFGASQSSLSGAEKEIIALTVAEINSCNYCLAAHTVLGKMNGLSPEDMIDARKGNATNEKRKALIQLSREIVSEKGHVSDTTLSHFFEAGYQNSQVHEVLMAVLTNIFTNYFNHINQTALDFPAAPKI